jgi:cytochrome c oxidase cbb3-type subunit III
MHTRIFLVAAFFSAALMAQTPPLDVGQQLFSSSCAGCHGLDGRGGEHAPDIATTTSVRQLPDVEIARIIRSGISAAGMPGFGSTFTGAQITAVVKYLRSLQGQGGTPSVGDDANRGRVLFFGKARCSECHLIKGRGGFLASDLSAYATGRSAAEIRDAIVNPDKNLDPRERAAVVVSRDGKKYTGVVRNEDNFSLQMQTMDGRFHLFDKSELARVDHLNRSIMPLKYGSELSQAELNDLAAYLVEVAEGQQSAAQ